MKLFAALRLIIKEIKLGNKVTLIETEFGWYHVEYTHNAKKVLSLFLNWKSIKSY